MNVVNQAQGNSSYAHPMVVYTEAPEHTRNMDVIFKVGDDENLECAITLALVYMYLKAYWVIGGVYNYLLKYLLYRLLTGKSLC